MDRSERTEQARLVVRMYQDGVPVADMQKRLRIGGQRMYLILKSSGVPMRACGNHSRQKTDLEKLRQAVAMYEEGEYIQTIKRNLHIAERSLYAALDEAGVPKRRSRGTKKEARRFETKRFKRTKRGKQTTTNIVRLQHSFGANFVGLANRVLRGELEFWM